VINLMFLCCESYKLDRHTIHPGNCLSSDHAPLSINIPIIDEVIQFLNLQFTQRVIKKQLLLKKSFRVSKAWTYPSSITPMNWKALSINLERS